MFPLHNINVVWKFLNCFAPLGTTHSRNLRTKPITWRSLLPGNILQDHMAEVGGDILLTGFWLLAHQVQLCTRFLQFVFHSFIVFWICDIGNWGLQADDYYSVRDCVGLGLWHDASSRKWLEFMERSTRKLRNFLNGTTDAWQCRRFGM